MFKAEENPSYAEKQKGQKNQNSKEFVKAIHTHFLGKLSGFENRYQYRKSDPLEFWVIPGFFCFLWYGESGDFYEKV